MEVIIYNSPLVFPSLGLGFQFNMDGLLLNQEKRRRIRSLRVLCVVFGNKDLVRTHCKEAYYKYIYCSALSSHAL